MAKIPASTLSWFCLAYLALGGCMGNAPMESGAGHSASERRFRAGAIRYFVGDVDRSVAFYSGRLGFKLEQRAGPAFAKVTKDGIALWLSGPGSSGARPMPDGRRPEPGGWNRLVLEVHDLPSRVAELGDMGVHFRNQIVTGPGGKQILAEDPDGNPIEFFEPAP
jgi:glyoxylase I family protein